MSQQSSEPSAQRSFFRVVVLVGLISAAAAAGITAILVNILEHKQEALNPFYRVVEIDEETTDPEVWGMNFPQQYDGYKRTVDQQRTRFGGSEAVPRSPSDMDPRSLVAQSRLEEDPRLKTIWAGYAFAVDFREERGHAYMLEDQTFTQRQQVAAQPGTCLNCHASMVAAYRQAGDGDVMRGFERINSMPYAEARKLVTHPVACIDCHDPKTMALRVTRPAFMEGIRTLKATQGVADFDVNRDATRQELRAYVCGQCHNEYYFRGKEKRLTHPWANGLRADQIFAYYEEVGHTDWVHRDSGAAMLKAQHPELETWSQGIHARNGVTCPDCHMPYMRSGALKISDHHIRSPLLNVNKACQTCHKASEAELRERAHTIQSRTFEIRDLAMGALVELINEIKAAQDANAPAEQLAAARDLQRRAQFFLDFVEAENSMGFHADQEAVRVLSLSLDATRRGQLSLRPAR